MVAGQARPWLMAETAANRTAPNSNNGSRLQHASTRRNGNKGRNVPRRPVQQGPVRTPTTIATMTAPRMRKLRLPTAELAHETRMPEASRGLCGLTPAVTRNHPYWYASIPRGPRGRNIGCCSDQIGALTTPNSWWPPPPSPGDGRLFIKMRLTSTIHVRQRITESALKISGYDEGNAKRPRGNVPNVFWGRQ